MKEEKKGMRGRKMGSASRKCSNRLGTEGKKRNWEGKKKKKKKPQSSATSKFWAWTCTHISGPLYLSFNPIETRVTSEGC